MNMKTFICDFWIKTGSGFPKHRVWIRESDTIQNCREATLNEIQNKYKLKDGEYKLLIGEGTLVEGVE